MTTQLKHILTLTVGLCLPLFSASGQTDLTSMVVYSTDSAGNYVAYDTWDTQPGGNFDIFIQNGSGSFLNGPTDSTVQPNISLSPGASSFGLFADPGADFGYFGINLFFNGSISPSISAFAPMLNAVGPHSFAADGTPGTPNGGASDQTPLVPGAGTLSFISGTELVTLTDFYWATPSVYNQDLVGQSSIGADGQPDFVGGIAFSVTTVPEPQSLSYLAIGLLFVTITMRVRKNAAQKS